MLKLSKFQIIKVETQKSWTNFASRYSYWACYYIIIDKQVEILVIIRIQLDSYSYILICISLKYIWNPSIKEVIIFPKCSEKNINDKKYIKIFEYLNMINIYIFQQREQRCNTTH